MSGTSAQISGAKHRAPTIETIALLTFYEIIKFYQKSRNHLT